MINIYYGRESADKEKFIYSTIGERGGKTLVIVPDQYTLEGEKQAFRFLNTKALMDVEIMSMSRLGFRLLAELGGSRKTFIDTYGRQMLIGRIARKKAGELQVFGANTAKDPFIEMVNDFISQLKQHNVTVEHMKAIGEDIGDDGLLSRKIADLTLLYEEYSKALEGKYTDAEDYIDLYTHNIEKSQWIRDRKIWIYGFDSFTPKVMDVLGHLMAAAVEVNVFITYDKMCRDEELFALSGIVIEKLKEQAKKYSKDVSAQRIAGDEWEQKRNATIATVQRELYAVDKNAATDSRGLTIVKAANMHNEAESAAAYVTHILRDKGYRYKDIVLICNDQKVRVPMLKRLFREYGLHLFDDGKRSIINSPISMFILGLIEVSSGQYRSGDIIQALKTGLFDISRDDIEWLENYAIKYRIKGSMWKKPFVKGQKEYGDEGLEAINAVRAAAMEPFIQVEQLCKECETIADFIEKYYRFLTERVKLNGKISQLMEEQEQSGFIEEAAETRQVWDKVIGLLDQIRELIGGEKFESKDFLETLDSGLTQMRIGLLPPTDDDILMGTMQRTRFPRAKALMIVGANEGLLPEEKTDAALFTDEELGYMEDMNHHICKVDAVRSMEEKLAIYRNLSRPSEELWISYSISDEEGKEIRPSEIVGILQEIFPKCEIAPDVLNCGDMKALVGGRINTLRHLTAAIRQERGGGEKVPLWHGVAQLAEEKWPEDMELINAGFNFTNRQQPLKPQRVNALYGSGAEDFSVVSPSRLEKYSRCPFSHFVGYGLRPEERRIFEASSREIGDVYHHCIMKLSETLTGDRLWDDITENQCSAMVKKILAEETQLYDEQVFHFGKSEEYKVKRIEAACVQVAWALVEHVRAGHIVESFFEVAFGRGKALPPVEVEVGPGERKLYIEGKIDRVDILNDDRVKIIDYKTGNETFDVTEAKAGYRLQLMLYLKAAQENRRKPAGVFYFHITDNRLKATGLTKEEISVKISDGMRKAFRLNGLMVDSAGVISDIAGDFQGYSDVVPLRAGKDGIKATGKEFLVSEEEFSEIQDVVGEQVKRACKELVSGNISITPMKSGDSMPCDYCQYKAICRFDIAFDGCEIVKVK